MYFGTVYVQAQILSICQFLAKHQIRKQQQLNKHVGEIITMHWLQKYVRNLSEFSIYEVMCNENVPWYKVKGTLALTNHAQP